MRRRVAKVDGVALDLTADEFAMLALLGAQAGRPMTVASIVREMWRAEPSHLDAAIVGEHVRSIRAKLAVAGGDPEVVQSVRDLGYRVMAI